MSKKRYSDSGSTGYYGYSSESRNTQANKKSKNSGKGKISPLGIILLIIQLILSISLVGLLIYINLDFVTLPILIGVIAVLIILLLIVFFMQKGSKNIKRAGKVISVIVIIIVLLLNYVLAPFWRMSGKKVSMDPFVVYVSAADTFGTLGEETNARSDTNIIAVVNPKTQAALIVSTPRDYYVAIQAKSVAPESYDKLTHVGLYGNGIAYGDNNEELSASDWGWGYETKWGNGNNALMDTLQYLYDFNVPEDNYHYAKLNFTGFARFIDALGGITVEVDQGFSTKTYASYEEDDKQRKTYTYTEGEMEMDGDMALTFARERKSFAAGDMQRNKNQVKVLNAIADKLLSGSTLLRYTDIVNSIKDCFTTDIDISSMVSLQTQVAATENYNGWNIMSYSVNGTSSRQICTYTGTSLSVVMQDEESVSNAKNLINMVINGETADTIKAQIETYNK